MLNTLWVLLLLFSVVCAAASGRMEQLSAAVFAGAENAVTLVIAISGAMCLWTGLMKIAEKSGAAQAVANLIRPAMKFLFPSCSGKENAVQAMSMNITANLLGLGNAATPLGIAAMHELKKKNPSDRADDDMVMFVVINASSLQLIPTFMAALRSKYGAAAPFDVLPAVWATSAAALAAAVVSAKLMQRFSR
jgi:spore maturation protein A